MKVLGSCVVNGRFVADREAEIVIDLVPERKAQAEVVPLVSRDTIDGRSSARKPDGVKRPQRVSVMSRVRWPSS
jgi:hypothetical protein